MDQRTEKRRARDVMQGCLYTVIAPAGVMAGLDTVRDCMKDETLRVFLGHALLHEIMPSMGWGRETLEPVAMAVCREMEAPAVAQPLALLMTNCVRAWAQETLPLLMAYQEREDAVPPCLCMSLALLIMLFAGVRQEEDGRYTYLKNGEQCTAQEDEEILHSFSRLSCDMPPETLAYAVLSDRSIWDRDLRDVPGLEDRVAMQLRDLQLLGMRAALDKAWQENTDR